MSQSADWTRFAEEAARVAELGFLLDTSTFPVPAAERARLTPAFERAFAAMADLEAGAVANPDEGRRVGHYWLRAPELAPEPELAAEIRETLARVKSFATAVHAGEVVPAAGVTFARVLVVGIGGSALGPQLAADALGGAADRLAVDFLDNTDPDGFERSFARLAPELPRTLAVVISKSGGTPETRNGLEETRARLLAAGLDPARHLVAVTGVGSALDERARAEGWLEVFPMWDWVGGRTSQTSAVGLLPLALAGHDIDALLDGAKTMDAATRVADLERNPAARLALAWHVAGAGQGQRDMVVIPYRDRLSLLARYLQQLVMESLGKREDLEGRVVRQGLAVYGNKGSTDQHAYVQQLRDGLDNYFLTLIGSFEDPERPLEVEPGVSSGDYLQGFLLGTRRALVDDGRRVVTIAIPRVDARRLGALIALFERAVGLYASLVGINAYHQPGVEAGKKAAKEVLDLQGALVAALAAAPETAQDAAGWAAAVGAPERSFEAWWVLEHLASSPGRGVLREGAAVDPSARYRFGT